MSKTLLERLLVASAAFALAACGGGGGSGLTSTPPPPPAPPAPPAPPPPPPASPASPTIFPSLTTNTNFAVLGLEAAQQNVPASSLARNGFSVRYDAATQGYLIDLPSTTEARLVGESHDASYWHGFSPTGAGFYDRTYFDILKPTSTNPEIKLAYTSLGISSGYYSSAFGFFAFGLPTPSSGVPVTGSASYEAYVAGRTLEGTFDVNGGATLQFNFGTGTLAGHFDPIIAGNINLGRYDFVNTVFGVGSTSFSGSLSHAGTNTLGAFDGRFTGPAAQELMSRWTAPYLNPSTQQWSEMFGVWVGKNSNDPCLGCWDY